MYIWIIIQSNNAMKSMVAFDIVIAVAFQNYFFAWKCIKIIIFFYFFKFILTSTHQNNPKNKK